jgi:hypothetical protein
VLVLQQLQVQVQGLRLEVEAAQPSVKPQVVVVVVDASVVSQAPVRMVGASVASQAPVRDSEH